MCGAGIEQHYLDCPDFDDLEDDERESYLMMAYEELCEQGLIPYGIMTADEDTYDNYPPLLAVARHYYEQSFE